ncbi:MAG: NTPase KAP, partial [Candidatus Heimdallarchaeota archaeon]|nr:NTPase KAP [Candidatus Heimdallarchaeota archaeon]
MVVEHIESVAINMQPLEKPIVVKFNPWNFSDQNQLIMQFFKHLSLVLDREDYAKGAKKAGKVLETYSKCFSPLMLATPWSAIVSGALKIGSVVSKSYGEANSKDLSEIRSELNRLLLKQPHKIIVVIDDIDRLNNFEIRQVFQLVKSLGDFPNVVYLLAFDRGVVVKALCEVQEGSGSDYLEKVVQVPFDIPEISKEQVEKFLFAQLNEIIKDTPEERWGKQYWTNIYHGGLKHFFSTIRDVNRYINSLRLSYGMVKGEVNSVDFLAITGFQVFLPEIYFEIKQNKDLFSGVLDGRISSKEKEILKKKYEEVLSKAGDSIPSDALTDFIERLFPKIKSINGNIGYGSGSLGTWRKELEVCSSDIFDKYFRLSLSKGELSQK